MSPPQPRILMTTDAVGGVWTYSATLARALCARGYRITLVTLGPKPKPEQLASVAGVRGLDIEVTDLALEWMDPRGGDMRRARNVLRRIAARVRPDLVHLNGFREALYQFDAPVVLMAHSCVGSWWDACRAVDPIEEKWRPYLRHVADALDAADVWIAATRAYADWIERFYTPRQQGEVIHNGAPPIPPPSGTENIILAAGRLWDEAKNLTALADIALDLPWPVRVAGSNQADNGGSVWFGTIEQLGILPRARLLDEMRHAAIFVSPALYEPFGLGILEAASSGCALVLGNIATLRELWDGAALFAAPRDGKALTQAIRTLCYDSELRSQLQLIARERAARYSLDRMVTRYFALYGRLTARHAPALALQEASA